ncbi:hypothetical protein PIB30_063388 [Stylosanthes scabra]|uniref:HSF-type DNA-binding domain-containing protein n=1 Tax=Stylosanthes scabra TaxID=79078 RepID=A0ABU6YMN6_9FABA|nr:hypothetical protein [Stylosanthes scabra]
MMVAKSGENGCVAPFLDKCYDMVSNPSTDSVICWGQDGHTFLISDITHFSLSLLPTYFKHNNFSSFIRQLNIYGFRKIDADRWEFANDNFVKGQTHLLKNIRRRKHPHNNGDHQNPNSDDGLWNQVQNLKSDKNSLMQELVKLRQHQECAENKLVVLTDRIQGMETHQQQMLSFLVMVVQNPAFMLQLLQPNDNNWRMTQPPSSESDGIIIKYKPPSLPENLKPVLPPSPSFENQPEPDLAFEGLKDLRISSEFLKVLMDEKLSPLENHSPFLLPDLPDDDASWEQLFLPTPSLETEKPTTPEDQTQSFESLILEMEKTEETDALELRADGVHLEGSDKLKSLTQQMELLASETDNDEEEGTK